MQNSMVVFSFSVLDQKISFFEISDPRMQNCQFKLKFGTKTNWNVRNSIMEFFSIFDHKYPSWANLVQNSKLFVQSEI